MNAEGGKRIRVLVVEDSPSVRDLLVHLLERDPRLEVVGTAGDGVEAVEKALRLAPDVVTMDIHMPKMDGLEATRLIMERAPVPIVVVSATAPRNEAVASFRVIEAGAVAMVPKPHLYAEDEVRTLTETVRLMAGVKVIRRWPRKGAAEPARLNGFSKPVDPVKVVAIGASTGGPPVLCTILGKLPRDFPAPVVITQHITPGFTDGFVHRLPGACGDHAAYHSGVYGRIRALALTGGKVSGGHCQGRTDAESRACLRGSRRSASDGGSDRPRRLLCTTQH